MRPTYKAVILLFALGLSAIAPAYAQDVTAASKTKLLQFAANNADFDADVVAEAKKVFNLQIGACKTVDKSIRQLPTPLSDLEFNPAPAGQFPPPRQGTWEEHVKVRGCNQIWTINMLAVARTTKSPILLALLPGETLSDPASQSANERVGANAIKKANGDSCADEPKATYTKLLGYKQVGNGLSKTDAGQGWFEEWTYNFCQAPVEVQMVFLPNSKGGFDMKARLAGTAAPVLPATKPTEGASLAAPKTPKLAAPAAPKVASPTVPSPSTPKVAAPAQPALTPANQSN